MTISIDAAAPIHSWPQAARESAFAPRSAGSTTQTGSTTQSEYTTQSESPNPTPTTRRATHRAAVSESESARQSALDELGLVGAPSQERFDRITRLARDILDVHSAAITLADHDRLWFLSSAGLVVDQVERRDSFCDVTIAVPAPVDGEPVELTTILDARTDARFARNALVNKAPSIRFYAGYPLVAPSGERIGTLCVLDPNARELSATETRLLRELGEWAQRELTGDGFAAIGNAGAMTRMQRGMMPRKLLSLPGFSVAGGCATSASVGSDFYDWYPVGEGVAVTLADVTGVGTAAAITAATVRAGLRSGARAETIGHAVEAAEAGLQIDDETAEVVTLFHARIDMDSGSVRYADAGHGLTLIVRASGGSERLHSTNLPLGAGFDGDIEERHTELAPGDVLVSVSDGALELVGGTIESLDRIARIVRSAPSAQHAVDSIVAFAGHASDDDVAILVLKRAA